MGSEFNLLRHALGSKKINGFGSRVFKTRLDLDLQYGPICSDPINMSNPF